MAELAGAAIAVLIFGLLRAAARRLLPTPDPGWLTFLPEPSAWLATYFAAAACFAVAVHSKGVLEYDLSGTVEVLPRSKADAAGLRTGDRITAVAGIPVRGYIDIGPRLRNRGSLRFEIEYERDGVGHTVMTDTGPKIDSRFGVRPRSFKREVDLRRALASSIAKPFAFLRHLRRQYAPFASDPPERDIEKTYAEFLRPPELGDQLEAAGTGASVALPFLALAALVLGFRRLRGAPSLTSRRGPRAPSEGARRA